MTETQEKFIYMMEHSYLCKGLPYSEFCRIFKDSTFTMEDIYHSFCLGLKFNEEFSDFVSEEDAMDEELSTHKCGRYCDDSGNCSFTECIHNKRHSDFDEDF